MCGIVVAVSKVEICVIRVKTGIHKIKDITDSHIRGNDNPIFLAFETTSKVLLALLKL